VVGCCEYGDEPSGSGVTELVRNYNSQINEIDSLLVSIAVDQF
jgi:hypothetical protein